VTSLTIGVLRESADGEQRVGLVPADVHRLTELGLAVLVESGAGTAAWHVDGAYAAAGAETADRASLLRRASVVVCVRPPEHEVVAALRPGQVVVGLLGLRGCPDHLAALAGRGVTAVSFDGLPRTVSRAQTMDALTSQANVAGYRAALVAGNLFGRLMPMQMTATGTSRPARVLVLGAGVAGLQAIGTARRLGAVVTGYDVRPSAREEIRSLGAAVADLGETFGGADAGGYARPLSAAEQQALPEALATHVARSDIVITTAQVPGRTPPLLVSDEAIKAMGPGSVIVDLAATTTGGNVAVSRAGETLVTDNGVTVVGAPDLAASVPGSASEAYSRNVCALLRHLVADGEVHLDPADEIHAGVVFIRAGEILQPSTEDTNS
jgi:H+-translocating NAD(P) transhydrogenase subunit alpha